MCVLRTPAAQAVQAGLDLGDHARVDDAAAIRSRQPAASRLRTSEAGSRRSRRMPGVSVRKTSFSACRWAATAAAAVSALTLSQPPSRRPGQRRDHRHDAGRRRSPRSSARVDARHLADAAEVDRPAVGAGQQQLFAEEALQRAGVQADGPAAELADLRDDAGVDLLEQDADDDRQRGVVGVAAALDLARLQTGRGHGAVDRLAAAVDQDRAHADRLHEDDVLQRGRRASGSSMALPPSLMTVSRSRNVRM